MRTPPVTGGVLVKKGDIMKKTILVVLVLLSMVSYGDVETGNIVGFQKHILKPGANLIFAPFMTEGDIRYDLSQLLVGASENDTVEFGDFFAQVQMVDGELHWVSNGAVCDHVELPFDGTPITYNSASDKIREITLSGVVSPVATIVPADKSEIKEATREEDTTKLYLADELSYTTIRLFNLMNDGRCSCGTGFFYSFNVGDGRRIPAIITNKHVIRDATKTRLIFTVASNNKPTSETVLYELSYEDLNWIGHPDEDVDLCFFPILPIINIFKIQGKELFVRYYTEEDIPDEQYLKYITQLDDVIMIGYPNGLWDEVNNQPFFRKGVLATRPNKNFRGKKDFVVDLSAYNGSSGSPILLFSEGMYYDRQDKSFGVLRLKLLGVLHSGFMHTAEGKIAVEEIPVSTDYSFRIAVPNNLGIALSSSRILELEQMVRKRFFDNAKP